MIEEGDKEGGGERGREGRRESIRKGEKAEGRKRGREGGSQCEGKGSLVSYSLNADILRLHRGWTTRVQTAGPPSPKRSVAMVAIKINKSCFVT